MTRREYNDIDTFWELVEIANEAGYEHEYYTEDDRDDYINDKIYEMCRDSNWEEIRDYLDDIPTGYEYYTRDYYGNEWRGVYDDEFDDFKEAVLEYCIDTDFFEDDEDEEDLDNYDAQQTDINHVKDTHSAYAVAERARLEELSDVPFEEGFALSELFQDDGMKIQIVETSDEDNAEADRLIALMSA